MNLLLKKLFNRSFISEQNFTHQAPLGKVILLGKQFRSSSVYRMPIPAVRDLEQQAQRNLPALFSF